MSESNRKEPHSTPAGQNASPDVQRKRQEQAVMFEKYLDESGLSLAFQIIFTEIIQKQIPED